MKSGPGERKPIPVIVHERQFEAEVLSGDSLVLVAFCAEWSGGCHIMAPVVESIARALAGRMRVVLVDIDRTSSIKIRYGVESVPALLFFRGGQLVEQVLGTISRKALTERAVVLLSEVADDSG